jgi:hypothetical protein
MPRQSRQITNQPILRFPLNEEIQYGMVLKPRRFVTTDGQVTRREKAVPRLTSQIQSDGYVFLPLPTTLQEPNRAEYNMMDLGLTQLAFNAASTVGDALQGTSANANSVGQTIANLRGTVEQSGEFLVRTAINAASEEFGGALAQRLGNVPNPYTTFLFNRALPRPFALSWVLTPSSEEESEQLHQIINFMRYYMLPSDDGAMLTLPHEWEIAFFGTKKLFDFSICVMVECAINWFASPSPSFYSKTDAPQSVQMDITFQEVYPLTKNIINDAGAEGSMYLKTLSPADGGNRPVGVGLRPRLDEIEQEKQRCIVRASNIGLTEFFNRDARSLAREECELEALEKITQIGREERERRELERSRGI